MRRYANVDRLAVNELIDRALREPTVAHFQTVTRLAANPTRQELAERVRRRATLLGKRARRQRSELLEARNDLMLAIYAQVTPAGWHCAWCDGSVADGQRGGGIGGLLMDADGQVVAELTRGVSGLAPFETEIAALVAILELARRKWITRLRVYSDCGALVRLWQEDRSDPRLERPVELVRQFQRFQLCVIPRLHNQPAHRLATSGATTRG